MLETHQLIPSGSGTTIINEYLVIISSLKMRATKVKGINGRSRAAVLSRICQDKVIIVQSLLKQNFNFPHLRFRVVSKLIFRITFVKIESAYQMYISRKGSSMIVAFQG